MYHCTSLPLLNSVASTMTTLMAASFPKIATSSSIGIQSRRYPLIVIPNQIRIFRRKTTIPSVSNQSSSSPGLYSAQKFDLTLSNVDLVLEDVRPYLIADGGNVDVVSVEHGVISLRLQGPFFASFSPTFILPLFFFFFIYKSEWNRWKGFLLVSIE